MQIVAEAGNLEIAKDRRLRRVLEVYHIERIHLPEGYQIGAASHESCGEYALAGRKAFELSFELHAAVQNVDVVLGVIGPGFA